MKIILRTAGVECETEELQWDLNMLINLWRLICEATESQKAPLLDLPRKRNRSDDYARLFKASH